MAIYNLRMTSVSAHL